MRGDEATRHISRIDQDRKRQHGWWVRIHRDKRMIQKFFSDGACGGRARALREAQKYRDALLVLHPKPARGNMFNRANSRNRSGTPGVHRTRSLKRGRAYDVWQAGYVLPDGTRVNRKFHFSRGGRSQKEARRLATEFREEGVRLIELIDAGAGQAGAGRKKARTGGKVKARQAAAGAKGARKGTRSPRGRQAAAKAKAGRRAAAGRGR